MREQRAKLSRGNDVAKAMDYMLKRWTAFTRFLDDGRICLSNNAAERGVRGIALGRKSWLFCGSDRGGERAAVMYSLIVTAKMNDIDPQAWLADVLARIAEHPVQKLDELLPWNWRQLNVRKPSGRLDGYIPRAIQPRSSPDANANCKGSVRIQCDCRVRVKSCPDGSKTPLPLASINGHPPTGSVGRVRAHSRLMRRSNYPCYSITSSARASSEDGTSRPRDLAV